MPITPSSCVLTNGQIQQFVLEVSAGVPVAANWSVSPPGCGTIDGTGLYMAPSPIVAANLATIAATPVAGGVSETIFIRLLTPGVIITPSRVVLKAGDQQEFSVTVPGSPNGSVRWNVAPSLGNMNANGTYTAPVQITEDRDVELNATSTIDPTLSGTVSVRLTAKPLGPWLTGILFFYLVAVFCLVYLLIQLWPPALPDGSITEKARTAHVSAETVAQKARDDEQKATDAFQTAQKSAKERPNDAELKSKADELATNLKRATESRTKSEDEARSALAKERSALDPPIEVFGLTMTRDQNLLWLVLITGALGAFVYSARSFVDFVGNRAIRGSWSVWYLMYPLIGASLALIFYLVIRGGFLTAGTSGASVNVYGLVAISGMVGMFSKQATTKLDELFSTLFKTNKDDKNLKDPLK